MRNKVLKILILTAISAATNMFAEPISEPQHVGSFACEQYRANNPELPYFYCDCAETAAKFTFGMTAEIKDTVWFQASARDVLQGISAYWFSDCAVQLEAYIACSGNKPIISMVVGKDQMREMDVDKINSKLKDQGMIESVINRDLPVRVFPVTKGGKGTVMVYPYNVGPTSDCGQPLRVVNGMTLVSSHAEDIYELQPETMVKDRQMFMQWKQEKNLPAQLTVHRGSCDGEIVATATLSDSTKLFYPAVQTVNSAKQAGQSLFFRLTHDEEVVGRVQFRTYPQWENTHVDTTFCQGMSLTLADTVLTESTEYGPDSVWMVSDTIGIYTYSVHVTEAETYYDTLRVRAKELTKYWYLGEHNIPYGGYGDYEFLHHTKDSCDSRYMVHVEHIVDSTTLIVDTTICEGKKLIINKVTYAQDTTIQYERWENEDQWAKVDLKIHFTAPETEYDTLLLEKTELPKFYTTGCYIRAFGDTTFVFTPRNSCTRRVAVHIEEVLPLPTGTEKKNSDNRPRKQMENGTLFIQIGDEKYTIFGNKI